MQVMQFLTNRETQLLGLGLKTWEATDKPEAVTLGHNWYNFLTVDATRTSPLYVRFDFSTAMIY